MSDKTSLGPDSDDLSSVEISGSSWFGITNAIGAVSTAIALGATAVPAVGLAQAFGWMGAVAGATVAAPVGLAFAGAAVVAAGAGVYFGGFDDRRIEAYNERVHDSWARGQGNSYENVERKFLARTAKIQFDPNKNTLPYDTLGRLVVMNDDKLARLPAHIQLDVYRTQMDMQLHGLGFLGKPEDLALKAKDDAYIAGGQSMSEKAAYFKHRRDTTRNVLSGSLGFKDNLSLEKDMARLVSPAASKGRKKTLREKGRALVAAIEGEMEESAAFQRMSDDASRYLGRVLTDAMGRDWDRRHGGGNNFTIDPTLATSSLANDLGAAALDEHLSNPPSGGGSSGSWGLGDLLDSGSSSSSSSSSSGDSKDAGAAIAIIVLAAAAVAAVGMTAWAVHKHYLTSAPKPLNPLKGAARALRSAEADVRATYGAPLAAPKPA